MIDKNCWDSLTYKIDTNCGRLYLVIIFDSINDTKSINRILPNFSKNGTCATATVSSCCSFMTSLIRMIKDNKDKGKLISAITMASGNSCTGIGDKSCIDQINQLVLDLYIRQSERSEYD